VPDGPWLVTGGAGFVGRALVSRLLDLGQEVVVLDSLTWSSHPSAALELGVELLEVDVADGAALDDALDHVRPSVVVHLAMESRVDAGLRDGAPFLQTNVSGAWNLGRAVADRGLRLVHVSHASVYGDRSDLSLPDEQSPVRPTTPLGASQACADAIVTSLCRSHRLDAVLVRSSNTYGPGQYPQALLPRSARRWAEGRKVRLGGEGFQLRDWLHVADHAAGIQAAAVQGESGRLYHLGGGVLRTNREVLLLWRRALGLSGNSGEWSEPADGVPGEDRRQGLDDDASRRALNWSPRWSIEDGLAQTASWLQENPDFWDDALARPVVQAQLASTWADA
jgi:dTDP-glucose 4,6-dehydratase